VLAEAEALVKAGVRELLIISQDTSAYGVDVKYRTGFHNGRPVKTRMLELVRELAKLGIWVRLHYVYPYPSVDDVIPLMAEGKVLPYLDVPFQHASHRILKAMKRPAHAENTLRRIEKWREICPDLAIRSTFIVGFPGETETDFDELLDFLDAAQLDRVGAFAYSPVDGAAANQLPDAVPEEVKQARYHRFMTHQAKISAERLRRKVGSIQQVLVDEVTPQGAIGRSKADAPQIDGLVYLHGKRQLTVGEWVEARIEHSDEHDLFGLTLPPAEPGH
jgi:ribosomal protein S12 methylthiotransferase